MKRKRDFKKNKKADMFQWMFALIVGGIILFIALYATFKFVNTQSYSGGTLAAKEFEILLNPAETSYITEQAAIVPMQKETQMVLSCDYTGIGSESIKFKQLDNIGKKYKDFGQEIVFNNKYVFSQSTETGKNLYFFSKKLAVPWNFDLIFANLQKYCFVDAHDSIKQEIQLLNISNIKFVSNENNCLKGDIKVKFYLDCDYDCENTIEGRVVIGSNEKYVKGMGLALAAAFSSNGIYYCNLRRIAYRASLLAELYGKKAELISQDGCFIDTLKTELTNFKILAQKVAKEQEPENNFFSLLTKAAEIDDINQDLVCRLW